MIRRLIQSLLPFCCLLGVQQANALGLGELRRQPLLGERLDLQIELVGGEKSIPELGCFRIVPPRDAGDLPWVKRAEVRVRQGTPAVLEVRSSMVVREPVLQLAIELSCGFDSVREYTMLVSPAGHALTVPAAAEATAFASTKVASSPKPANGEPVPAVAEAPARLVAKLPQPKPAPAPVKLRSRPVEPPALPQPVVPADQVRLSLENAGEDPGLRLSEELATRAALQDAQRDLLRLEYRMLGLMHEQASSQLAAAEKLRQMEGVLGDLQRDTVTLSQRLNGPLPAGDAGTSLPIPERKTALPPSAAADGKQAVLTGSDEEPDWWLYGALLGGVLGIAGWVGWRRYQDARHIDSGSEETLVMEGPLPAASAVVDLPLDQQAGAATQVDFVFDAPETLPEITLPEALEEPVQAEPETPESYAAANPVMELADIMLSFGRVKGAAQTLQEYIDSNPQDALQPWIRCGVA